MSYDKEKLQQGLRAYFPPNFYSEIYSSVDREKFFEEAKDKYLKEYEEYYIEIIENLFEYIGEKLLFTPIHWETIREILKYRFELIRRCDIIIRNFNFTIERYWGVEEPDLKFFIKLYDTPRNEVDRRLILIECDYKDGNLNFEVIDNKFLEMRT